MIWSKQYMTKYNFDEIIDRHNTNSIKWDFNLKRGMSADALPLWVADMDFRCPRVILEDALNRLRQALIKNNLV